MLDLAIVGGGPAGLAAGLYATRGGLSNVVMFEKGLPGGAITQSSEVENYPGVCEVVTGMELMECWPKQAMRFGLRHEMEEVHRVTRECNGTFTIHCGSQKTFQAKAVIVCTGSTPKRAGFEGEEEFFGKGVSTCATCDGFFYKDKEVAVLGGGDTALEEALYLSKIASKVYLIHRRDAFRAAPATVDRVLKNPKIELILNATIKKAYGDQMGLQGVIIDQQGKEIDLQVPGVFVFVGMNVNNDVLKQEDGSFLCSVNHWGEVIVDLRMRTDIPGLFAAGDIRADASKQVVCAAGDGATAAINAIDYIEKIGELRPC
ncbi:thioredoxin-disulfide reductase [Nitratiruptor sp. SB155-2]|uniref:thioredoxin-disulfide reductase n=1 Tax=Nitratiruptor sp. (strain SB155-2) TaxID=387092 RepID=UPI000158722F|nr:thioredoxin-disulfide reductase [Nitratiruptor sp. SB155-2]BAF70656.1 thioredoxin reductase [Nitratiruptor sp. SB155-2]